MSEEVEHDRRRFLLRSALAFAAAQCGSIGRAGMSSCADEPTVSAGSSSNTGFRPRSSLMVKTSAVGQGTRMFRAADMVSLHRRSAAVTEAANAVFWVARADATETPSITQTSNGIFNAARVWVTVVGVIAGSMISQWDGASCLR